MNIAGRDYQFLLTVKARREIRALCPGGEIEKLADYLDGPEAEEHITELILVLSRGHEEYRQFWDAQEGREYEPHPLSMDLIERLSMEDYRTLETEAYEALRRGMGITVETEEPKDGKGKKSQSAGKEKQS